MFGWVRLLPNKRKSGCSSGPGGARGSTINIDQVLEAVLAENPQTPVGDSGSAADDSVLEGLLVMQSPHA